MAEMKLEIPQDMVLSIVKAQVVAALGKSEQLIAGVVESALGQKANHYDKATLFETQVTSMIRDVALECFREWMEQRKEDIRKELTRQLTAQKSKVITELVSGLTAEFAQIYPSVTLKIGGNK